MKKKILILASAVMIGSGAFLEGLVTEANAAFPTIVTGKRRKKAHHNNPIDNCFGHGYTCVEQSWWIEWK